MVDVISEPYTSSSYCRTYTETDYLAAAFEPASHILSRIISASAIRHYHTTATPAAHASPPTSSNKFDCGLTPTHSHPHPLAHRNHNLSPQAFNNFPASLPRLSPQPPRTTFNMAPLAAWSEGMNTAYDSEPVRFVVSTQFLIKMGVAGFLVSLAHNHNHAHLCLLNRLLLIYAVCSAATYLCVVQIWAGWHYSGSSHPCNHSLALWLWVNGAAWLVFLSIFALSVLSSSGQSGAATFTLAACFPCAVCAMCVVGPFLVVWFIVGNIWIFLGSASVRRTQTRDTMPSQAQPLFLILARNVLSCA